MEHKRLLQQLPAMALIGTGLGAIFIGAVKIENSHLERYAIPAAEAIIPVALKAINNSNRLTQLRTEEDQGFLTQINTLVDNYCRVTNCTAKQDADKKNDLQFVNYNNPSVDIYYSFEDGHIYINRQIFNQPNYIKNPVFISRFYRTLAYDDAPKQVLPESYALNSGILMFNIGVKGFSLSADIGDGHFLFNQLSSTTADIIANEVFKQNYHREMPDLTAEDTLAMAFVNKKLTKVPFKELVLGYRENELQSFVYLLTGRSDLNSFLAEESVLEEIYGGNIKTLKEADSALFTALGNHFD